MQLVIVKEDAQCRAFVPERLDNRLGLVDVSVRVRQEHVVFLLSAIAICSSGHELLARGCDFIFVPWSEQAEICYRMLQNISASYILPLRVRHERRLCLPTVDPLYGRHIHRNQVLKVVHVQRCKKSPFGASVGTDCEVVLVDARVVFEIRFRQ